jgi:hypothetical protein
MSITHTCYIRLYIPDSWVTVGSNPNSSEIIWVDFVFYKLSSAIFMNINTTCLTMVNFTSNNCRVSTCLYFKTSNPVIVNVIWFKITLKRNIWYFLIFYNNLFDNKCIMRSVNEPLLLKWWNSFISFLSPKTFKSMKMNVKIIKYLSEWVIVV